MAKLLGLGWKFHSQTKKIRQIDRNYVKSAKDFVLGRKFHSQNSLRTKIRQFDEIFGRQRKFPSKILFSKLDGNVYFDYAETFLKDVNVQFEVLASVLTCLF